MSPVVITVRTLGPSGTHVLPALNSQSGRKGQRSSWASNHLSKTASPRSHPARRGGRPRNRSPSLAPGNRFPVTQQEPSLWTVILWVTHRWPLPGAGAGMGAREASHSRGGMGCVSVAWSMAPPAEPLRKEKLAGRPRGPPCTLTQRTSCLYFRRKHTFPWFTGRGGWGDRQGNCLPAPCQGAG